MSEALWWIGETKLAPDNARVQDLVTKAEAVLGSLTLQLPSGALIGHHLFGSIPRQTSAAPATDLDVLVVLDRTACSKAISGRLTPKRLVDHLWRRLNRASEVYVKGGNAEYRSQYHSVRLTYPKRNQHIDLVPAFNTDTPGHFCIPEVDTERWILTSPFVVDAALRAAHEANPALIPALRLIKSWRRMRRLPLPSYALEWKLIHLANAMRIRAQTTPLVKCALQWLAGGSCHVAKDGSTEPIEMRKMDKESIVHTIFSAKQTLDVLDGLKGQLMMGSADKVTLRRLLKHFVGDEYLDENDNIREGNLHSVHVDERP